MVRLHKGRSRKAGLPPGTLIHIGERKAKKTKITLIDYNADNFEEREVKKIEECFPFRDKSSTTWINIDGLHDPEIISKIGDHFEIHPLVQEDILNTGQRPKLENFDEYAYIVLNLLYYDDDDGEIVTEQMSIILGKNFVISFQEVEGDVFNPVRDRLRVDKSRVRKAGPDYLAYMLLDAIVDNYFVILEKLGENIEDLEEILLADPSPKTLKSLRALKREMIFLRKSVWPLRELISGIERMDPGLINKSTKIYMRDVYDHTIQVIDTVETFRDMLSGMLDIYLSSVSNRMNEVMKVLTVIATIFIPLTFITGLYGMNFRYMPELQWTNGYPLALFMMLVVALLMLAYFKRKKWV